MKKIYFSFLLVLFPPILYAQTPATDTIVPSKGNVAQQLQGIKDEKKTVHSDSTGNQPAKTPLLDSTKYNRYGDLLDDDPEYNKKYPIWKPALQVIGENVLLNLQDRYVQNLEFAKVDMHSWKRTLNAGFPWGSGWEWDQDRFGNNFLSHPMMGNFYYNSARSNGYNYWESAAFVFAGSYMWKIFGENGTPEREDLINTTFDGVLLGEVLYRVSSDILDDRTTGSERFFRELLAGVIDPVRGFNRLVQGKSFRRTNKEVYQKEPMNISLYAGIHNVNNNVNTYLSGHTDEMLNVQLDYGNPFELSARKPFDLFRLRAELNFGIGRKIADNITGYGILFGKNIRYGKLALLVGGLQYYDYFDTKSFELSTIAFGGGVFSKLPLSKTIDLYNNFHLAIVPFGGSSVGAVSDTSQSRDYRFGNGFEGKIESGLALGKYATISLLYYYFYFHAFDNTGKDEPKGSIYGTMGYNSINMLKPRVTVRLFKDLSIGAEHDIYFNHHYQNGHPSLYTEETEQRIFLMLYFENPQRRGHYK